VLDNPTAKNVMLAQDSKLRRAVGRGGSSVPSPLGGEGGRARADKSTQSAQDDVRGRERGQGVDRPHKPLLDEMGIATWHEIGKGGGKRDNAPRKPTLDEMGPGVEAVPARPNSPRSTMGRPGQRGGFKSNKRR